EEDAHAEYAISQALYKAQEALLDFYDNFPGGVVAGVLKLFTFPAGRIIAKPSDRLIREMGDLIMEDNPVRQHRRTYVYRNAGLDDATGRVENTYRLLLGLGALWNTFARAQSSGKVTGDTLDERLQDAANKTS